MKQFIFFISVIFILSGCTNNALNSVESNEIEQAIDARQLLESVDFLCDAKEENTGIKVGNDTIGYVDMPQEHNDFFTPGSQVDQHLEQWTSHSGALITSMSVYNGAKITELSEGTISRMLNGKTYDLEHEGLTMKILVETNLSTGWWTVIYTEYEEDVYYFSVESYSQEPSLAIQGIVESYLDYMLERLE